MHCELTWTDIEQLYFLLTYTNKGIYKCFKKFTPQSKLRLTNELTNPSK